jgi:serine protease Do
MKKHFLLIATTLASYLSGIGGYSQRASAQELRKVSGFSDPIGDTRSPRSNAPATVPWRNRDEQYAQLAEEVSLLERQNQLLRKAVRLVTPTVVHIEALKEGNGLNSGRGDLRSKDQQRIEEAGSGVVIQIGSGNYVLTNRHVIHTALQQNIRIETFEGIPLKASRVWDDPSTDLAVLDVRRSDLPVAKIGDSRSLEVGDYVFAVGSPFGLNHSVSYGIVSAKGRRNLELGSRSIVYQDFIQTDAAINPGNSGGPLMNMRGEVVGINTAIASNSGGNEGIGFSIPINLALHIAKQLVERGEVQRSYLGVSVERAFNTEVGSGATSERPRGAFVKVIKPNSPAEFAGLRYGDVILEFDGIRVDNDEHLVQLVGLSRVGNPIDLLVLRDSQIVRIEVELVGLPNIN